MLTRSHVAPRALVTVAFGTAALVLASACSPAPMPVSQSPKDPSSPVAPEGASPPPATLAMQAPAEPKSSGHEHHHGHAHGDHGAPAAAAGHEGHGAGAGASADGGTEGTVYVCPMHPEVTSTAPGALCPKCNMKLVPKK